MANAAKSSFWEVDRSVFSSLVIAYSWYIFVSKLIYPRNLSNQLPFFTSYSIDTEAVLSPKGWCITAQGKALGDKNHIISKH